MVVEQITGSEIFDNKKISDIIELRKQGTSLKDIGFIYKIPSYEISKILKKNLEDYQKYYLRSRKDKPIDVESIIKMRKNGNSLEKIADINKIHVSTVRKVLLKHLKDYSDYALNAPVTEEEIETIIRLRKEKNSIRKIAIKVGHSTGTVGRIIRRNLEDYQKYNQQYISKNKGKRSRLTREEINKIIKLRKQEKTLLDISRITNVSLYLINKTLKTYLEDYQNYYLTKINRVLDKDIKHIIKLRKQGKSIEKISDTVRFNYGTVNLILIQNLANYKKYSLNERKKEKAHYFKLYYDEMISTLHLRKNNKLREKCANIYLRIKDELPNGSQYGSLYRLAPAVIFLFFKLQNFQFEFKNFVDNLDINREVFLKRIKYTLTYFPEYNTRDPKIIIFKKITSISKVFGLGVKFNNMAKKIMYRFWDDIKFTKDDVIVGVVCFLTLLKMNITSVSCAKMCKKVGISMSAVHYQVNNKIFKQFSSKEFKGLKKSSEEIKFIINKCLA